VGLSSKVAHLKDYVCNEVLGSRIVPLTLTVHPAHVVETYGSVVRSPNVLNYPLVTLGATLLKANGGSPYQGYIPAVLVVNYKGFRAVKLLNYRVSINVNQLYCWVLGVGLRG